MSGTFAPFLTLRQLPSGRAIFALREVNKLLGEPVEGEVPVVALLRRIVDLAIDLNVDAFRKRRRYEERKGGSQARGNAAAIDPLINEAVKAIQDLMLGLSKGTAEDDDEAKLALLVLQVAFAGGLAAIVQVPFEIQVSTVDDFLALFDAGDPEAARNAGPLHHVIEPLRLQKRLDRLEKLNRDFETELNTTTEVLTLAQVDQAFQRGQQALHRAFLKILSTYDEDTAKHIAERSRLIAPILFQDQRVAELNRRSRRVTDVNPDTGTEEVSEPPAPTPSDG